MEQHRTPDRTPGIGHLGSQLQRYGPEKASLPATFIECAAVYGPEGSTRGATAQTLVRCAGVHSCQTTGRRIKIETWSKEGRPCSPPCIVQYRVNRRNTQSLGADPQWGCTSQARQIATRRRYEAEVNHVAAPCQRKRQVHLQQDVAVT